MNARALAPIAAALAVVAAIVIALVSTRHTSPGAFIGTPIEPPKAAADALLRDGAGHPTHVLDRAAATMIFFGYTHCPDTCPLALASLGRAYRSLAPADRARTRIVFVTVDPGRDTAPVVARYVRNFDAHIVGLTGDARTLASLREAYGVHVDARPREIVHSDTVFAVDASARMRFIYPADTQAKDFAHDLALLAR